MYRFQLVPVFVAMAIIVVACSSQTTPTPEQEQTPTEEPTEMPAEAPAAATASGELTGTIWSLTELNGESLVPTTNITAEFSEDGRVAGSSGCNNYAAAYEVDGNNININTCCHGNRIDQISSLRIIVKVNSNRILHVRYNGYVEAAAAHIDQRNIE